MYVEIEFKNKCETKIEITTPTQTSHPTEAPLLETTTHADQAVDVLSVISSFPLGYVTPTKPSVYVVTDFPMMSFYLLQHQMPILNLIKALRESSSADFNSVLDIGSGTGALALYASKLGCHVVAVEPNARQSQSIRDSIVVNKISNLEIKQSYVFDSNTVVRKNGESHRAVSLKTVLENSAVNHRVGLIRISTGGYEHLILKAGLRSFREDSNIKLSNLIIEINDISDIDIFESTFDLLLQQSWRPYLLRSGCSERFGSLGIDPHFDWKYKIQAYPLTMKSCKKLFTAMMTKITLKGIPCPIWLVR